MSEDPVILNNQEKHLNDPQGLNFYAYSRNNPLVYLDPSGGDFVNFLSSPGFNNSLNSTQRVVNTTGNLLSFGQFEDGFRNAGNAGSRLAQKGINPATVAQSFGELSLGIGRTSLGGLVTGGSLGELKLLTMSVGRYFNSKQTWGNIDTLDDHLDRHGGDFGVNTSRGYAKRANDFLLNSEQQGLPTKIDGEGVKRIYDSKTNTLGSYNPNGTTRTFFKPNPSIHGYSSNNEYWESLPGTITNKKGGGL